MSRIKRESRESDERLLDWLRRRRDGESASSIGRRWGVNQTIVILSTKAVAEHDLEGGKASAYPWFLLQ